MITLAKFWIDTVMFSLKQVVQGFGDAEFRSCNRGSRASFYVAICCCKAAVPCTNQIGMMAYLSIRLPIIDSDTIRPDAIFGQRLRLRLKCESAKSTAEGITD
jgi:hypothetical protein